MKKNKKIFLLKRVTSLPDALPKIDFDSYKSYVPEKAATIDKISKAVSR